MSTLLVGGLGNIGRRYQAILKHIGEPYEVFDSALDTEPDIKVFDRWIIASPTDTHTEWCGRAIAFRKPFLVEKPLSKNADECYIIADAAKRAGVIGCVVCNYKYAIAEHINLAKKAQSLTYDYYNHGKDTLEWDCCQIIYLDEKAELLTQSPIWTLKVNDKRIPYSDVESSYIDMVADFVEGDYDNLWSLEDGIRMTESVIRRIDGGTSSHPG